MVAGAFALAHITAAALAPMMGLLADKYGPRIMIFLSGLFTGGTYLLISGVTALWQFYLIFAVTMGIGKSTTWGSVGPTISRWFVVKRGLAQGIVQAGAGLGTVVFPLLATYLIFTHSWRFAYLVLGLLLAGLIGLLSLIYQSSPQKMGLQPDGNAQPPAKDISGKKPRTNPPIHVSRFPEKSLTLRQALKTRSFRLLAFAALVSNFTQQLVLVHLVPHATDVGFSPAVAAIFMSVLGVFNIIGKLTMGIVSDYIGRRNSLIISFSLAVGMLFWLMIARDAWAFYLFAAVYGFAYGSWIPMFPAIAGDLFGLGALGAIYGALSSSTSIGGAMGPIFAGWIFDVTQSYNYAFIAAAASLMTGIVFLFMIRLPGRGERTQPG